MFSTVSDGFACQYLLFTVFDDLGREYFILEKPDIHISTPIGLMQGEVISDFLPSDSFKLRSSWILANFLDSFFMQILDSWT